jgi:hypothetical protein
MFAVGCSKGTSFPTDLGATDTKADDVDGMEDDDSVDSGETGGPEPGTTTWGSTTAADSTTTTTATTDSGAGDGPMDNCMAAERPPGIYGDCKEDGVVDNSVCGNASGTCLVNALEATAWSVCMFNGCTTDCECPGNPAGTAVPVCEDVTGDGATECRLDCRDGGTCPPGMRCEGGSIPTCVWDDFARVYGDCMNGPDCGEGLQCVYNAATRDQATMGVCVRVTPGCEGDEDCPGWSDYTTVDIDRECDNVQELSDNVCFAGCGGSTPCPPGMECFEGVADICMWPKK